MSDLPRDLWVPRQVNWTKVSIAVVTYNHAQYLAQALDSVLMQQVSFRYEIVVGEDFSTDGTRKILLDYAARYPDRVRPIFHERNVGMYQNGVVVRAACRGEYLAILDGDDYWTDPRKLQRQVDLLDAHPECSGCFSNAMVVHDGAPELNAPFREPGKGKERYDLKDMVSAHIVPTSSLVFRVGRRHLPDWLKQMPMIDWPLHVLNTERGPYLYLDEVMAVYRVHDGGAWSRNEQLANLEKVIGASHIMLRYLEPNHPREIGIALRTLIQEREIQASEMLMSRTQFARALVCLVRAFWVLPRNRRRVRRRITKLLAAWRDHYRGTAI